RKTDSLIHSVETYSNLLFYDYGITPRKSKFIPDEIYEADYDQIKQRLYVKDFWDENPVLLETPIEKQVRESFEASKSFGKTFNNSSDTFDLINDGYFLWDAKKHLTFDVIKTVKPEKVRLEKLEITQYGEPVGGL